MAVLIPELGASRPIEDETASTAAATALGSAVCASEDQLNKLMADLHNVMTCVNFPPEDQQQMAY